MRAVLERDFVAEASRTRSVVLRTVLGGVVAAVAVIILWSASGASGASEDQVGRVLYFGGTASLLALLFLLTPPLVVGSILTERTQGTLDLLLASPVGARSLALAKVLSRSGVALLFGLAGLPAFGLCLMFGGVPLAPVFGTLVAALAIVLEVGAWGVWVSTLTRRPATAAVLSYLLPLTRWWLFVHIPYALASPRQDHPLALAFLVTTPYPSLLSAAEVAFRAGFWSSAAGGGVGGFLAAHPALPHLVSSILLAAALVVLAGFHLRREAEPPPDPLRRFRGKRFRRRALGFENPVTWKEVRLLNTASSRPLFYSVLAVLLVVFAISFGAMDRAEEMSLVLAVEIPLVAFVAAVNAALTLGHERTQGSWDLLRASRLRPGHVVAGKLAGVFRGVAFLALIPAVEILGALLAGAFHFGTLVAALAILTALPASWAAVGLSYGIRSDRRREAVIRTCVLFGILLVGFPCIALLVATTVRADELPMVFLVASPPAHVFVFTQAAEQSFRPGAWSFHDNEEFIAVLWFLFFSGGAAGLLRALPRWLARRLEDERGD